MKTILNFLILLAFAVVPEYGQAQLISVSGYVKNFVSEQVLENVSVYENESGIGTISNNEGYYKLLLKPGQQHLKISRHGYESYTSTFKLSNDTVLTVRLKPNNYKLPELADGKILAGKEEVSKKEAGSGK
jgi:hypothetical protein